MELSEKKKRTKNQTFEVFRHVQKQNVNVLIASQAHCFGDVLARARGKVPRLLRWDELKYLVAGETESTAGVRRSKVRSCPRCRLPSVCLIGGRHSYKLRSCFHLSRRRARSDVLAGLSCALTTGAEAPPPYRQKRVYSVHTRHQEAKDL